MSEKLVWWGFEEFADLKDSDRIDLSTERLVPCVPVSELKKAIEKMEIPVEAMGENDYDNGFRIATETWREFLLKELGLSSIEKEKEAVLNE